MANRRMFSKTITNSSRFLMMPQSAQALYFHFGMNADDDGFCEHFPLMRMTESKPDDLKILQAKGFVVVFDERVLLLIDWKENNYLRNDRYTPSKYLKTYNKEMSELGIPTVSKRYPQDRIGKVRIEKNKDITMGGLAVPSTPAFLKKSAVGSFKELEDWLREEETADLEEKGRQNWKQAAEEQGMSVEELKKRIL